MTSRRRRKHAHSLSSYRRRTRVETGENSRARRARVSDPSRPLLKRPTAVVFKEAKRAVDNVFSPLGTASDRPQLLLTNSESWYN